MLQHTQGYVCVFAATIIWSGIYAASAILADSIPPLQSTFWRWVTATLCVLPFSYKALRREYQAIKKYFAHITLMSILGASFYSFMMYKAGQSSPSMNMALINSTTPIIMLIFARFVYKQKLYWQQILGMALVLVGVIGIICQGDITSLKNISFLPGDLWVLACATSFAIYSMLAEKKLIGLSSSSFVTVLFSLGALFTLPFALWEMQSTPPIINISSVLGILYSGIGASALSYWLWMLAIEKIGAVRCGFIFNTMPLFSALVAIFVLGEKITFVHIYCGIILTLGVIIGTKK